MINSLALSKRFREVILDGTWIANTNFKAQLTGLNWQIANAQYKNLNSISVLARHIHYYILGIKNVFIGGNLEIKDSLSFTFPPINSQMEWEMFLDQFWTDAEEFATWIAQLTDEKLEENFVEPKYGTVLRNIDGMIEHSYYHLGQIVLIKKLLADS